jgi:hypothetical protein
MGRSQLNKIRHSFFKALREDLRWSWTPSIVGGRGFGYALRQNLGPVRCSFSAPTALAHIARAAVAIQIVRIDSILQETDEQ